MSFVRLALAQVNPTVGDLAGNVKKITGWIEEAKVRGADIVIFPELVICGYPPEDLLLKPSFIRACREGLEKVASACQGIIAIVGFPEGADDLYNSAALICESKVVTTYRKMYLPNYGVFDEDRYFASSRNNIIFQANDIRFGVSICEDIWYSNGPPEAQAVLGGAELLINISASPYHKGKGKAREQMLAVRAVDSVATLAFCNLVGGQDELVFDGGSVVLDPNGSVLARGKQFDEDLVLADVDLNEVFRHRLHDPRRRKERLLRSEEGERLRRVELDLMVREEHKGLVAIPTHVVEPLSELAEIYQALVLGTRDYVRKNGFRTTVVGLSGGIDSSLVVCIAADALGPDNLVGVAMPSQYSSEHSLRDAAKLADNLGVRLLQIPIHSVFKSYLALLRDMFKEIPPDATEENLQARIRGNILMALSNKFGWLVLTTGNKSECSVGYATLYGDMAGGFSVIKDVPKTLVYKLGRYRNTVGLVVPEDVFIKPPSAELRPDQRDSDSLPPYEELDPMLEAYVEKDLDFAQMLRSGFDPLTLLRYVRMVDRAEYKRRQAAPGIKITSRAFGKDRRLPITNWFDEEELL